MGERLDFLLRATEEVDNYWMRFETANGRIWRAILRYEGADDVEPPEPAAPPSSSQVDESYLFVLICSGVPIAKVLSTVWNDK